MRTLRDQEIAHVVLSRRRVPRVSIDESVTIVCVTPNIPVALAMRDLSFRGFAIETSLPVVPRAHAQFEFHARGDRLFVASAVAVHCYRRPDVDDRWVSGWEFPEQPGLDAAIERLIDESVGVLTID